MRRHTLLVVANAAALLALRSTLPAHCRVAAAFDPLTGVYADRVLILRAWNVFADTPRRREQALVWLEQQVRSSCPDETRLEWFGTLPELVAAALASEAPCPEELADA